MRVCVLTYSGSGSETLDMNDLVWGETKGVRDHQRELGKMSESEKQSVREIG